VQCLTFKALAQLLVCFVTGLKTGSFLWLESDGIAVGRLNGHYLEHWGDLEHSANCVTIAVFRPINGCV